MKTLLSVISPGTLISQVITGLLAFYLLVADNGLHCSISSIITYARSLQMNQHAVVLGMLPIYIAAVIFGAAILGAVLGKRVERFIINPLKNRKS